MNKIINISLAVAIVVGLTGLITTLIRHSESPKYSEGDCIALAYEDIRESWETPLEVYAIIKKVGIKKYLVYIKLDGRYSTEKFKYTEIGSIKIECPVDLKVEE